MNKYGLSRLFCSYWHKQENCCYLCHIHCLQILFLLTWMPLAAFPNALFLSYEPSHNVKIYVYWK
jgi:hypothetical protein